MSKFCILEPGLVLVLWSLIMLLWLVLTRMPAIRAKGINLNTVVGSTPGGLDNILDAKTMWPAHNYNHLMEQPTLFYFVVAALAVMGGGTAVDCYLAWAYVGLRVLHSLVQAIYNRILHRFLLFALSTGVLIVLAVDALRHIL